MVELEVASTLELRPGGGVPRARTEYVPGHVATFESATLSAYYLIEPLHNFSIASATSSLALMGMVVAGVLTSILMEWLHRERRPREVVHADQLLVPMKRKVGWSFGIALALLGIVGVTAYLQVVRLRDN